MFAREAIQKVKNQEMTSPRDLTGKDKEEYRAWVKAFADGTLSRRKSLQTAAIWIKENLKMTCGVDHVKHCLMVDSDRLQHESEKRDKSRKGREKINTTSSIKRVKKTKTTD